MQVKRILKEIVRQPVELLLRLYLPSPKKELTPANVRKILVFAYHGLGNFIMYTPALKLLRARYPNARIDLQVGNNTGCEEVLEGSGVFDNIYNLPYEAGLSAWARRAREIRATSYDVTINEFHSNSWPLALLLSASRVPYRIGHITSPGWSREFSRYSFLFNVGVPMLEDEHEVDRYFDLTERLGVPRKLLSEADPSIHLLHDDEAYAAEFFEKAGIEDADVVLGIQPGTSVNMRWKQWPVERFRNLMESLVATRPDVRIVMFGSAHEAHISLDLTRGLEKNVVVAAGHTTVKQVAAMIARCDALLCNDSGLMHVAVAVGTPVVAIYGPTDLRRTRPLGRQHLIVRHEMECSPCYRLEGEGKIHSCRHHDCLATISPDEVVSAVARKLGEVERLKRASVSGAVGNRAGLAGM